MEFDFTIKEVSEKDFYDNHENITLDYVKLERGYPVTLFKRYDNNVNELYIQVDGKFYFITHDVMDLINAFCQNSISLIKNNIIKKLGLD